MIGGAVAVGNLLCVWLFSLQNLFPYIVYVTFATEISIIASFLLNDRFTFRTLATQGRAWYLRCLRFHSAAALGAIVTVVISTAVYHATHCRPIVAQFTAIICATGVNFSIHRLWTYRKPQESVTAFDHLVSEILTD
jgi:dolichol-phosphate mannosyltransferase